MKRLLFLFTFLFSLSLAANETVKTRIYNLLEPSDGDTEYLLMAANGFVYGVPAQDQESADKLREAVANGLAVELSLKDQTADEINNDERSSVEAVKLLRNETPFASTFMPVMDMPAVVEPEGHLKPMDNFSVTRISQAQANGLFRSMRNDLRGGSECYNRAHVWSWEIYNKNRYNTGKMFLFFTRRYINEYRYKWWFHVAPFINVSGQSQHVVLDRQYFASPRVMHSWTDAFMKNNANCPVLTRYSSYSRRQYENYCYLIPASMYYWQPWNLDYLERYHQRRSTFYQRDINHAYRDARGWWPW